MEKHIYIITHIDTENAYDEDEAWNIIKGTNDYHASFKTLETAFTSYNKAKNYLNEKINTLKHDDNIKVYYPTSNKEHDVLFKTPASYFAYFIEEVSLSDYEAIDKKIANYKTKIRRLTKRLNKIYLNGDS